VVLGWGQPISGAVGLVADVHPRGRRRCLREIRHRPRRHEATTPPPLVRQADSWSATSSMGGWSGWLPAYRRFR